MWKLASLSVKILSVLRFVRKAAIDVKPRALKPEERLPLVKLLGLVDLTLQPLHLGLRLCVCVCVCVRVRVRMRMRVRACTRLGDVRHRTYMNKWAHNMLR